MYIDLFECWPDLILVNSQGKIPSSFRSCLIIFNDNGYGEPWDFDLRLNTMKRMKKNEDCFSSYKYL